MSKLVDAIQQDTNFTTTENGAKTPISTLSAVLDFFYHAPARRGQDNTALFLSALSGDRQTAIRALFYVRDIRGGQGERETFRQGLRLLQANFNDLFKSILAYVPEYGRWDDMIEFVNDPCVQDMVKAQFAADFDTLRAGNSVSLLAKWLPSANTSSNKTKALARKWVQVLGLTEKDYRKTLSALRARIDIVEAKISAKSWTAVNYSSVPSKASLRYRRAFVRHDLARYQEFLAKVMKGEAKINAGTLYPYELVQKYLNSGSGYYGYGEDSVEPLDATVEALWSQLPNYADTDTNSLVVCDVSGSMFSGGNPQPIAVSVSLAIYLAERNRGVFKDSFLTFSEVPSLQKLQGKTLFEKVRNLSQADWGMSTDLQAVFSLILETAVAHQIPQSEMPTKIFIVSDMEFNMACDDDTNFEAIKQSYLTSGYEMPTLVFWNVASRNKQAPVTKDEAGTMLVSGCSPSIFKNTVNCKATTPEELMMEVLNGARYSKIVI